MKKIELTNSKFLEIFFQKSLGLFCIADTNGYFRHLNPMWSELTGFTLDELKSKPFIEFVHPEDRESTIHEASKLAAGEHRTIEFQNRYLCKNGKVLHLQWTTITHDNFLLATAVDVTSLKQATRDLDEKKTQLEGVIQNVPGMVYQVVIDDDFNISFPFVSEQCQDIYGISAEEFLIKKPSLVHLVIEEDKKSLIDSIEKSQKNMSPNQWSGRIINLIGEENMYGFSRALGEFPKQKYYGTGLLLI